MNDFAAGRSSRLAWQVAALVVVLFIGHHAFYVWTARPVVGYMDTLRLLVQYDEFRRGERSLAVLWNQGEHRGLVFQLLVALNAELLAFKPLVATLASGLAIAATVLVVTGVAGRDLLHRRARHAPWRIAALAGATASLLFSPASFELFTLDIGLGLFLKNLVFVAYFIALDAHLRNGKRGALGSHALGASAAAIILVVAMGWSYAFFASILVLAGLHVVFAPNRTSRRQVLRTGLGILLLASIALAIYVVLGGGIFSAAAPAAASEPGRPVAALDVLQKFLYALSSTIIGLEAAQHAGLPPWAHVLLGSMTLGISTLVVLKALRCVDRHTRLAPFAMVAYALLCAVAVCMSRARGDPMATMASRYFMDYSLLWIGLTWIAIQSHCRDDAKAGRFPVHDILLIAAAVVLASGQVMTYAKEWVSAPYRAAVFDEMRRVTLEAAPDEDQARLLQSPVTWARRGTDLQRRQAWGPFSGLRAGCSLDSLAPLRGVHAARPQYRPLSERSSFVLKHCNLDSVTIGLRIPDDASPRDVTIRLNGTVHASRTLESGEHMTVRLTREPGDRADVVEIACSRPGSLPGAPPSDGDHENVALLTAVGS